jgi:A/G-specific adenine glycosylase
LCATRGELAPNGKSARQTKREIHYALHGRDGEVFLVQRARDASLMAGMWELPEVARPVPGPKRHQVSPPRDARGRNDLRDAISSEPWLTLRHSITVTDYTVRVWRTAAPAGVGGKWVPVARLRRIALTGLARKILHMATDVFLSAAAD